MPLDQSRVGEHIAQQMEAIEADYGDSEEQYVIGDICTIVEVRGPEGAAQVRMRSSSPASHATLGLLKVAEQIALSNYRDSQ
jgi:hypothetical protein